MKNKNRVALISNDFNFIPDNFKKYCQIGNIDNVNKVKLLTVKEVKGLEFDTCFVNCNGFTNNEKYIAYTRALSELYIY